MLQIGPSFKSIQYMQKNHVKYPNWCPYWIGPFIYFVFTANIENVRTLLQLPGGKCMELCYCSF